MPDEAHDGEWSAEVWADEWNPEPNVWSPSHSTLDVTDETGIIGYQEHTDVHHTSPMSEQYGDVDEGGGSIPAPGMNLLTNVRKVKTPAAPPLSIIQHEVHTYETGAELFRVRQRVLNGATDSLLPVNLLEANPSRKRALIRIVPNDPGVSLNPTFSGPGTNTSLVVPAGKTWTLSSIFFTYTADAVAANRFVRVRISLPSSTQIYQFLDGTATTATQVDNVGLAPGNPTQHAGGASPFNVQGSLPPGLVLPAGTQIIFDAVGADAGDTIVGSAQVTQTGTAVPVPSGGVFIGPRDESSSAATQAWWKIAAGDPPLEVKTQEGIDAALAVATDQAIIQVIEELLDPTDRQPPTGLV